MRMRKFWWGVWCSIFTVGCGVAEPQISSLDWPIMGTVARVSAKASTSTQATSACHAAMAITQACYTNIDVKLSAWRKDSELNRLKCLPAVEILATCDPTMRHCYATAFQFCQTSGGAFNPRWRGEKTLDLGAIAKGFAVDLAAKQLAQLEYRSETADTNKSGLLLDLGGNLKVVSGTWRTGVRNPFVAGAVCQVLTLTNGMACATSGEYERGKHIYDARTNQPVTNDVAAITVVHPSSAMLADALSTTLFVLGFEKGERFRSRYYPEATAYWVFKNGTVVGKPGL